MVRLVLLLLAAGFLSPWIFAQKEIWPVVAPEFGRPIVVVAEFVRKPSDYYSQNMVATPYLLRVIKVGSCGLPDAVTIEYELDVAKSERGAWERSGVFFEFDAYETVSQTGVPGAWMDQWEQGRGFALVHRLCIRPINGKGAAAGVGRSTDEVVLGDDMRTELRCVSPEAEQFLIRRVGDWAHSAQYSWALVLDSGGTSPERESRRYVSKDGKIEMYLFPCPAFNGSLTVLFRAEAAGDRGCAQREFERFCAHFAQEVSARSGSR